MKPGAQDRNHIVQTLPLNNSVSLDKSLYHLLIYKMRIIIHWIVLRHK